MKSNEYSNICPTLTFIGKDLFIIKESGNLPGGHSLATLTINYAPTAEAERKWNANRSSGPGIYGCFWDGRLFYVGTYAGTGPDALIGNVGRERWAKHIGGMTLRGRRLGIARRWLNKIVSEHDSPLARLLAAANPEVLTRDKGLQTQYSKFRFADRHWEDFSKLNNEMLGRFQFIYVRPSGTSGLSGLQKSELDSHLRRMEQTIIEKLNPPCNSRSTHIEGEPEVVITVADHNIRTIMNNYIVGIFPNRC